MSTIVAVRKDGRASIAADSLTSFGSTRQNARFDAAPDKILQFGDSYIGVVGSAAHQMVLESAFTTLGEEVDLNSRFGIFETFRKLHPLLKDQYFLNPKDEDEDDYESSRIDALIVNPSGIFGVFALREVFEYTQFWAIGSGAEYALGAMHVLYDQPLDADTLALNGVSAGAEFDTSSSMPHTQYSIALASAGATVIEV